jgi:predicted AAA+ superfamily ATPase
MSRAPYLESTVTSDLESKMLFVAGPRQVGKTTMARRIFSEREGGACFNWDNREDRGEIRAARWPGRSALVVLDEIHKWSRWKGWLKGEFDKHRRRLQLPDNSARLAPPSTRSPRTSDASHRLWPTQWP